MMRKSRKPIPPNLAIGGVMTALLVVLALASLVWTPYAVDGMAVEIKLNAPSAAHLMGTDGFGRDILSRIMRGAWHSLSVGAVAVGIGLALGVPIGMAAGLSHGSPLDGTLSRMSDTIFAFPALLSAVLIAAVYGPGAINAIVGIAIFNIAVFARVARGATIAVSSRPFIQAARAMGRSGAAIAIRHALPNIAGGIAVQATIQFAVAILAEAGLSYLGLGIQPPAPSWGKMLADAQTLMFRDPLQAVWPGLAIMWAVLGLNLLGDGLRDRLDPRLRPLRIA